MKLHFFEIGENEEKCDVCGSGRQIKEHYCSGMTREEWQPIADASERAAADLPEG